MAKGLLGSFVLLIFFGLVSCLNYEPIDKKIVGKWITTDIYPTTIMGSYYDIQADRTLKIVLFDPKKNVEVETFNGFWKPEKDKIIANVDMFGNKVNCLLRLSGDDMIVKCDGGVYREERFVRM